MDAALARTLWHHVETLNAVTYFCQECRNAPANLGLAGFWAGYFACRAAPMGAVSAGVVEATFFNFHPARVRKALPAAWTVATPDELVTVRSAAAARALRRLLPDGLAEAVAAEAAPALRAVVEFLRDAPGSESLGIAYAGLYMKVAPAGGIDAPLLVSLGTMTARLC
jgi:hypothetical protein